MEAHHEKDKNHGYLRHQGLPHKLRADVILKGTGADIDELGEKPLIAVLNSYTELNPGHMHLRAIAEWVKKGVFTAGDVKNRISKII